ncbi:glucan biosynthesis protein G [Rhodosalinus halophilus]|uniref:Glucan biosynthesis protein G n=1 Tax=Rhodosalinus halophilus TaxID=2259333 RepID=A0A365U5Z1_9RHOB|nr:glucan biosynthesis protein G [Rhodosalinus halophilus]
MRRRAFLAGGAAAAALARAGTAGATPSRGTSLVERARRLATHPYARRHPPLPPPFDALTYDSYRAIRPKPGAAAQLQLGPGYAFDLLPPGFYFDTPVTVEIAGPEGLRPLPFSPALFDFDPRYFPGTIPKDAPGAGFSGLRLRHPLNEPQVMDEVLVVQGASYFRAVAAGTLYGLSARAVALGTGGPAPEEFPEIVHLRLTPATQSAPPVIEALIDSPSLAACLTLRPEPGQQTVTRCALSLFPRRRLDAAGLAPLTSMFFKGPMQPAVADDFRPRVHDSAALRIDNGAGETLWRPLANPAQVETSAFLDHGPRGFGLIQRPRDFAGFEDAEAGYHRRPTAWVRPSGDWGRGAVMLVEIPTADEFMDNVVAFWRPERPLLPGVEHRFAYDILWSAAAPHAPGLASIRDSRSGRVHDRPGARQFVVDFATRDATLTPDLSVDGEGVRAEGLAAYALPGGHGLRVGFQLLPGKAERAELRLVLRDRTGRAASPVWLWRWTRARDGGV